MSATATNNNTLGQAVPLSACASLPFTPLPLGLLNTTNASTSSGYDFRLTADQEGLVQPSPAGCIGGPKSRRAPAPGVTVNPSVGAG